MNIRVVFEVKAGNGIDDAAGLLGCGSVIQPNQRFSVDLLMQNREVGPDLQRIEDAGAAGGG